MEDDINNEANTTPAAEDFSAADFAGQPLRQPLGEKLAAVLPENWKGNDDEQN
jgi:hypothetical protein